MSLLFQNVFHKTGYPSAVWYILGNEFCERFSYYGMHGKVHFILDYFAERHLFIPWSIQLGLAFQIFDNVIQQHTSSWIELSNVNRSCDLQLRSVACAWILQMTYMYQ